MSYKTYTTEALVCGSTHHNTSDKNYLLFCKEAGMVWASARSVREERSKQRCALQDFSHIRVSLVKGKSGWRIGSAEALSNPFLSAQSRQRRGVVKHVVSELRRYVHGEVPLQSVYDDAFELLYREEQEKSIDELLQRLFSVRLLSELGYIAQEPAWAEVIEAESLASAYAVFKEEMATPIALAIHEGSVASHL